MKHAAPAIVLAPALAGCLTVPLAHPLRATNGFTAEVQGTGALFSEHARERTDTGFNQSSGTGSATLGGSAGYSHVFADRFGVMGGLYGPAFENQKNHSAPAVAAAYSFFTYQLPLLSVGAGPEVGYGGTALTMGLELGPFAGTGALHVGAYARWFWPFVQSGNATDDHRSHEFGARARLGLVYLQYAYNEQMAGLRELDVFGTTYSAHAYHQLTLGVLFDASTVH